MAQAMVGGLIAKNHSKTKILINAIDIHEARLEELRQKPNVTAMTYLTKEAAEESDVLVLAVKPQQSEAALKQIASVGLSDKCIFLSIVAGLPIQKIADSSPGTKSIIRAMPNTPASIGKGITVWSPSEVVNDEQFEITRGILSTLGAEEKVDEEDFIDTATAVSGSGPAYILLLMESMIDCACHMGMTRDLARILVEETFIGTAEYVKSSGAHTATLRDDITTIPATAAALNVAETGNFRDVVFDMTVAAYERARELGGKPKTKE